MSGILLYFGILVALAAIFYAFMTRKKCEGFASMPYTVVRSGSISVQQTDVYSFVNKNLFFLTGSEIFSESGYGKTSIASGLNLPSNIQSDSSGNIYFIENINNTPPGESKVSKISNGVLSTLITVPYFLSYLTVDLANNIYAMSTHLTPTNETGNFSHVLQIVKFDPSTNALIPIAGSTTNTDTTIDGPALSVGIFVTGLYVDITGNILFTQGDTIRRLSNGNITTIARMPMYIRSLATDTKGNIYVICEKSYSLPSGERQPPSYILFQITNGNIIELGQLSTPNIPSMYDIYNDIYGTLYMQIKTFTTNGQIDFTVQEITIAPSSVASPSPSPAVSPSPSPVASPSPSPVASPSPSPISSLTPVTSLTPTSYASPSPITSFTPVTSPVTSFTPTAAVPNYKFSLPPSMRMTA